MQYTLAVIVIIAFMIIRQAYGLDEEALLKETREWNEWAKKNQNNRKFKYKKYKPAVQTLDTEAQTGGIEAMRFLHMYRNNQKGSIGDKIDLFKEFFLNQEKISRKDFERLSAVWLKRHHYEMVTGKVYAEQEHVYKKLQRQNARKFANEEIRNLPINLLIDELDEIFPDKEKVSFSLVETVHWLVDGNLYGKIGLNKMKEIFKDDSLTEKQMIDEASELPFEGQLKEDDQELVNKIDL